MVDGTRIQSKLRSHFWKMYERDELSKYLYLHVASIINDYEDEEDVKPVRVKQSNTIVYNRIDKAGSTTLISRNTSYPYVI